jgi:hypothetical protein
MYRVYHEANNQVFETAQVTFIESAVPAVYVTPKGALKQPIGVRVQSSTPIITITA